MSFGPTREVKKLNDDTYQITVTPPKWSGFARGSTTILNAEQYSRYVKWQRGECMIQDAFPEFSASMREELLSGIPSADWDAKFKAEG